MAIIAVNDYIAARGISGSSRTAQFICAALSEDNDVHHVKPAKLSGNKISRAVEMITWDYLRSPRLAHKMGADAIVHCANVGLPHQTVKSVLVVHDVMALDHPNLFDANYVRYLKMVMPLAVTRAACVVTPSEHSKARILERWPRTRVVTVPWALPAVPPAKRIQGSPGRYDVLVVSSVDKHKRLDMCVAAVALARDITGIDFRLNIVGRRGNAEIDFQRAQEKYDPDAKWVFRTSNIDDQELAEKYESSFCLIVSSIDEGFCLPVIEAGSYGLPVVHSGRGALNEVTSAQLDLPRNPDDDIFNLVTALIGLTSNDAWSRAREDSIATSNRYMWQDFVKNWNGIAEEVRA